MDKRHNLRRYIFRTRFSRLCSHGATVDWISTGTVTATNICGTSTLHIEVGTNGGGPPCGPSPNLRPSANTNLSYEANFVDPCDDANPNIIRVPNNQIQSAKIYDIYGTFIKDYYENNFSTINLNRGLYILKVQVNDTMLTRKIIVQ